MSEKKTCVCPGKSEQFKELQPVLDKYAKVPGSLITILQKTQDIYGYPGLASQALYVASRTVLCGTRIFSPLISAILVMGRLELDI